MSNELVYFFFGKSEDKIKQFGIHSKNPFKYCCYDKDNTDVIANGYKSCRFF